MSMSMTARDAAGLFLVRRARSLVGPNQLRLIATAFLLFLSYDLVRIFIGLEQAGTPVALEQAVAQLLTYLMLAATLWRPLVGCAGCLTVAALGVLFGGTGLEPITIAIALTSLWASRPGRAAAVGASAAAAVTALAIVLNPDAGAFYVVWFGGGALLGITLGLTWRAFGAWRGREARYAAEVAMEDSRLRADERRILARELHDTVTHQLSNVSMQVMGHADGTEEELRTALKRIGHSSDSALTELRLMIRVLRDDPGTQPCDNEVAELDQRRAPTVTSACWARQLREAGFDPVIEVPAAADRLDMTVQQTITRTLDIASRNIVQHALPNTRCQLSVLVNASTVTVHSVNQHAQQASPVPGAAGWGLRGLRERVHLLGGTFRTDSQPDATAEGPNISLWTLTVTLPHD